MCLQNRSRQSPRPSQSQLQKERLDSLRTMTPRLRRARQTQSQVTQLRSLRQAMEIFSTVRKERLPPQNQRQRPGPRPRAVPRQRLPQERERVQAQHQAALIASQHKKRGLRMKTKRVHLHHRHGRRDPRLGQGLGLALLQPTQRQKNADGNVRKVSKRPTASPSSSMAVSMWKRTGRERGK